MTDTYGLTTIKTLQELANLGFGLANELDYDASRAFYKDDRSWQLPMEADDLRATAQKLLELGHDPELQARLEGSPLLKQATPFPFAAPKAMRLQHFEQLRNLTIDFASAPMSWEAYFAAHQEQIVELWAAPPRWAQAYQAEQERRAAAIAQDRAQKLAQRAQKIAEAAERTSGPERPAPCLEERRKNGLQCNRGDLVEIQKLLPLDAAPQPIQVSIKRCAQCWQLYKDYFVSDAATHQARSYFLKPEESDDARDFQFSAAEAAAASQIDFSARLNPVSTQAKLAPGSD